MKKRVLSMLLALVLLCGLLPQISPAVSAADSGSCGKNLNWSYQASTGTLKITGSGEMTDYTEENLPPWIEFAQDVKALSLPDGLTSVGDFAFIAMSGLKSVKLPAKVTRIGLYAFALCSALKTVSFPKNLTRIEGMAFLNCESLTPLKLPNGLQEIGPMAFEGCVSLTEVILPKTLKSIGVIAFYGCTSLKRIVAQSDLPYMYYVLDPLEIKKGGDPINANWKEAQQALGPFEQTEIYAYAKGAEGDERTERRKVREPVLQIYQEQEVTWSHSLGNYAVNNDYKFYALDRFVDVKGGDPCQVPVAWAVANKITAGMDKTHFAPTQTVTRAQAMTFFWAAQKKPKFKNASTQFVDVKKTDWFYKSVMWAVENGVTAGTDAKHFSPNKTCNRGEILAFLYAALKKPKVSIKNPYKDVSNQWYKKAALWAWANGIEKGESGKFNASTPCTRGSVVTYLYRFKTGMGLAE